MDPKERKRSLCIKKRNYLQKHSNVAVNENEQVIDKSAGMGDERVEVARCDNVLGKGRITVRVFGFTVQY